MLTPYIFVGEIVAQNYNAAGIFRQFGPDFCSGDGISHKNACEKKKLDLTENISELGKLDQESAGNDENFLA
ncbi:MAG: hypothetical protein EA391_08110 [Balneolaceae bacterium]|nr:MAG: hypothetical protein EA391_08110 [Balneolaceae bacterium]